MNRPFAFILVLAIPVGIFSTCTKTKAPDPGTTGSTDSVQACDSTKVLYCNKIKPIIDLNCAIAGCHVSGFPSGDFTQYAGVKAKVDNGNILLRVFSDPPSMPPSNPLPASDTTLLGQWLREGAKEK